MSERRCYGCMRPTASRVCEHCGWPADGNNDPHQLPVGTVLSGKYQVGRVLGQGGFGITYLGWDMNLDIQVCIKEFYPSTTVNRDVTRSTVVNCNTTNMEGYYAACLDRFLREGKALAKFRNVPQIVGIHDFFQMNNTAYMVMEFVSGIDMAKYVQKRGGRLHMDEILKILKPVMEALQLVHEAGIIHRDISPDNIMLEPREGAKLLDFGAVRNVEHPDAEKELTRATEAILKNGFAPMEQYVAKGSLGPWTDVYAMSATIYYCLTGRIPEDAPIRVMEGTELDWTGAQGLTEQKKAVLEQGMAVRAKDRISSIRELIDKLYAPEETTAPAPAPQPKKDPLRTELITEFKVNVPQPEPAPAAKEPAAAVLAESAPTPTVTEPVSTPVAKEPDPTPVVPTVSQPRQKDRSLWGHVAFMVVLVVAVLAAIFLLPKKDEAQTTSASERGTTQPTTEPTNPTTKTTTESVCRVSVIDIWAGGTHTLCLWSDGKVTAVGSGSEGQLDVNSWENIIQISARKWTSVGLKDDGTVVAAGWNYYNQCEVSSWTNIIAVSTGGYHTVALKSDGTVVATGLNNFGQCDVSNWTDIVAICAGNEHTVGLRSDGTVVAVGRNDYGTCDVSGWSDVIAISSGEGYHTVGLKRDGTVVATGLNEYGQCDVSFWSDIVAISAGAEYTIGLRRDGTVVAVGQNGDGQCNVFGWKDVVQIGAGYNHTVGVKKDGSIVAVGNGYGACDVDKLKRG